MNNIHPLMQMALIPFLTPPPNSHDREVLEHGRADYERAAAILRAHHYTSQDELDAIRDAKAHRCYDHY